MHQLARGVEVLAIAISARQFLLFLDRQHRNLMHGTDIGIERA